MLDRAQACTTMARSWSASILTNAFILYFRISSPLFSELSLRQLQETIVSFARASSHPARGFPPPSHGCRPASYCSFHDSGVCPREIQALGVSQCRGIWKSRHNYQSSAIEQVLGLRKSLCSCLPRKPRYSHSLRITAISYGPCYIYHIHDDRATMPSTIMVSS